MPPENDHITAAVYTHTLDCKRVEACEKSIEKIQNDINGMQKALIAFLLMLLVGILSFVGTRMYDKSIDRQPHAEQVKGDTR